jgi:hypothetical protein
MDREGNSNISEELRRSVADSHSYHSIYDIFENENCPLTFFNNKMRKILIDLVQHKILKNYNNIRGIEHFLVISSDIIQENIQNPDFLGNYISVFSRPFSNHFDFQMLFDYLLSESSFTAKFLRSSSKSYSKERNKVKGKMTLKVTSRHKLLAFS